MRVSSTRGTGAPAILAGPFRLGRHGRGSPHGRVGLCVAQSGARASLVVRAQDWRWSSTRAHLTGKDDGVSCTRAPVHAALPALCGLLALEANGICGAPSRRRSIWLSRWETIDLGPRQAPDGAEILDRAEAEGSKQKYAELPCAVTEISQRNQGTEIWQLD